MAGDDVWTFNLRANQANQDSDSDDDDEPTTNSISEETRLLQELDISHREETVVYKPNPFSIAKINAAARRPAASAPLVVHRPTKPALKKPTGRIVDSFKKAEKKSLNANPAMRPKAKDHPPSADSIPPPLPKAPHTTTSTADSIPRMDDPRVQSITPKQTHVIPTNISSSGPGDVLPPRANELNAHISTTFPPSKSVSKKFRPLVPVSFSSPLRAQPLEPRSATITNPAPRNQFSFSSPLRPTQFSSTSVLNPSAPTKYPPASQIPTNAIVHPPHSNNVSGGIASNYSLQPTNFAARQFHHTLAPLTTSPPTAVRTAVSAADNARVPHVGPIDRPAEASSTQSRSTPSAYKQPQPRRQQVFDLPPSSPIRSPIPAPSPSPRSRRTTARKPVSPKKASRTLKRQTSDAYDYFRSDPDDNWSTLPTRKKFKAAEPGKAQSKGIKTTALFRLPGTSTKGKITGMSATSERRVVTFLPPPLKAGKVEVLVENVAPRSEEEQVGLRVKEAPARVHKRARGSRESSPSKTPKRRRLAQNPYPSPATSRLSPGENTIATDDASNAAHSNTPSSPSPVRPSAHRFPSPPTSDPMPDHDSEVQATVTVDNVSQRYPLTKSLMRQRKHGSDGMWDLLELPSCGTVHTDESFSTELPVVVWESREVQV
ncbi:hypothetical protein DFH06DRAFT_1482997 [Mycena polygramma]|nr:hypothetical protein DFH06DRAFT_1482997 [Mycena polygramma]